MLASVVLGFIFTYQAKRLTCGMSPKWHILCRVGRKTVTQSISLNQFSIGVRPLTAILPQLYPFPLLTTGLLQFWFPPAGFPRKPVGRCVTSPMQNSNVHVVCSIIVYSYCTNTLLWEVFNYLICCNVAFSALTMLDGRQKEHLLVKNRVIRCKKLSDQVLAWLSLWSKVQMICILSRADATATPSSLGLLKSRLV